jgi:hypothetical protein
MCFERVGWNFDAGFYGGDAAVHDQSDRDATEPHADHLTHPDRCIGNASAQPDSKEIEEDNAKDKDGDEDDDAANEGK